jgi:hypothetical protein
VRPEEVSLSSCRRLGFESELLPGAGPMIFGRHPSIPFQSLSKESRGSGCVCWPGSLRFQVDAGRGFCCSAVDDSACRRARARAAKTEGFVSCCLSLRPDKSFMEGLARPRAWLRSQSGTSRAELSAGSCGAGAGRRERVRVRFSPSSGGGPSRIPAGLIECLPSRLREVAQS